MGWTFDRNGKAVWVGDGQPETRQRTNGVAEMAAAAWPQRPQAAGVMVAGVVPEAGGRGAEVTPFAESFTAPEVRRPTEIPPVTVEADRMRPPVVEGVTMRRGAPGSGDYGARLDLTPTAFRRDAPMSVDEGVRNGLVYAVPLPQDGPQDMRGANAVNADPSRRAFNMDMTSEDAGAMRQGFRDTAAAGRSAAAMRATGRVGGSKDIVARILGEQTADAASGRRMAEARVTPQVRDGVAYDPLTGKSAEVQRGGTVRPTQWSEYTPKELGEMVNEAVKSMMPEGDSKAFQQALMMAKDDAEKAAVYQKFSARPTPAQSLIMDTALAELKKREGSVSGGAGGAAGGGAGKSWREVVGKK